MRDISTSALAEIEQRIREDWAGPDPVPLQIVRTIARMKEGADDYITPALVSQLLALDDVRLAYKYLEYLASERIGLLEVRFELKRDDGTWALIEGKIVAEALRTGEFLDSDTGKVLEEWKKCVAVYYSASTVMRDARRALDINVI